jgi:hypothetical protein
LYLIFIYVTLALNSNLFIMKQKIIFCDLNQRWFKFLRWQKPLMLTVMVFLLGVYNLNAQVSGYSFAQSSGTYTAVTGTPILVNTDFGNSAVQDIGFTFNYNATNFTQFIVSADGSMRFGTVAPTSGTAPISTATNTNAIAACARDGRSFGGVIVSTTGTAPNRVCTIQWTQYQVHWSAATTEQQLLHG